jgi:hypothetical protein
MRQANPEVGIVFSASRSVLVSARVGAVAVCVGLALTGASASAAETHVKGVICGVKACAAIPSDLAVVLSQRDDSFSPASKPRPRPYYKVRVTADGTEGYISRLIVWVPSKHLFRAKDYAYPPLAPYWRTGNKQYESQFAHAVQAGSLEPFPASRNYK